MSTRKRHIYRVVFQNQGQVYEVYAREVSQGHLYAFVEVADFVFGERSQLLLDPAEEKLKSEFAGVKRSFIPLQAMIRIDEVEREGQARISEASGGNVTPFPSAFAPPGRKA